MANKLTVLITCKNEIKNIRPCIESVRPIADELVVADSGSSDGTLDVVHSMGGCRIIEREYIHCGSFKNWAIPQCANPWILIIDADERVTPELATEIKEVLKAPAQDGYRILRRNFFLGHEIKRCGWNHDDPLRLFRRDGGRYTERNVHNDIVIPSGKVGTLKAKFLHYTYWSMEQYLEKFDRYSTLAAQDLYREGRSVSALGLLARAPLRFLSLYILRGGFLDGIPGLVLCTLISFYSVMKRIKLWALRNGHSQHEAQIGSVHDMDRDSSGLIQRPVERPVQKAA
jgi:(heptosyl)LPS beta-1,4-glucosyltransferase